MFAQITEDLTKAMKEKDAFKLSVLRMLKSALKNEEINKKSPLTDEEVLASIKKQVKVRKDSKEEYVKFNRLDIADNLEKEIEVLSVYLPEELSLEELNNIIDETIKEVNADSIKQMGLVIKSVASKCGTRADMKVVSEIVKDKLNNM